MHDFERPDAGGRKLPLGLKILPLICLPVAACSSLGASGPTVMEIKAAKRQTLAGAPITIVEVTDPVVRRILAAHGPSMFSQTLGDAPLTGNVIGAGDILQVTILEAPPAVLFGPSTTFGADSTSQILAMSAGLGQRAALPDMTVDANGRIRVPFAGSVLAGGLTPQQLEREIAARLAGKAHDPQVAVSIARNSSSTVAVVSDDGYATRVALNPRGERLLDVISYAGGVS